MHCCHLASGFQAIVRLRNTWKNLKLQLLNFYPTDDNLKIPEVSRQAGCGQMQKETLV